MNIGVIGYANASGLGNLIYSFKEMLPDMCQMIVQHPVKDTVIWYKPHVNDCVVHKDTLTVAELEEWVETACLDVVFMIEYPFCWDYLPALKGIGVKTVMMPLLDATPLFAYKYIEMVDAWAAPTDVAFEYLDEKFDNVYRMGVPIDTERYAYRERGAGRRFLHNAGYTGSGARKSTRQVIGAFEELDLADTWLSVNMQVHQNLDTTCGAVEVNVCNVAEPETLYEEGDVFVYPSTAEGIGLQILEAMSCGFPVITTNWPPMNEYVTDPRLLVSCTPPPVYHELHGRPALDFSSLKDCIRYAAANDLIAESRRNREYVEKTCGFENLRPQWIKFFQEVNHD